MRAARRWFPAFVLLPTLLAPLGCDKDKSDATPGAAPPPPPASATAMAGACASGGGTDGDATSAPFFPRLVKAGPIDYCIDPQSEVRAFGEKAKLTLEDVCTSAVDGECEVYKRYGLKRFVSLRYIDGSGAGGGVEIY